MMNRYITALLIVLAATGVEAQTYQSALKLALTDISYDEFIQKPEFQALEEDIMSVIKAIKAAQKDNNNQTKLFPGRFTKEINIPTPLCKTSRSKGIIQNEECIHCKETLNTIVIRGPNCCL